MGTRSSRPRHPLTRPLEAIATPLRRVIPRHSAVGDRLRRWRHRAQRQDPTRPIEQLVDSFARAHRRASFVQVGSNDGVRFDPICLQVRTRPWTGIMVEPVPYLFDRLRLHYGGNRRIRLENSAIADREGTRPFYVLGEADEDDVDLPSWYDALGSFRRDVVLSHRGEIPDIEDRLQVIEVPTLTFESLCEKHALEHIDVVHIDTEGYDFEIIKQIDLARWQPKLVLFEHLHLSASDRQACAQHLASGGYELVADAMDTLAIHRATLAAERPLAAAWAAARAAAPSAG